MKNKIKLPKSIKLFLLKQLKKVINQLQLTSACMYPKTLSIGKRASNIKCHEATLFDVYLFILKNFPSYYDDADSSSPNTLSKPSATSHALPRSNSSMEPSVAADNSSVYHEGMAVVASSNDPFEDFKSSMMKTLEAHHAEKTQPVDWEFLEELLLCYLQLNEKHMHKSILRAYTDITAQFHHSFSYERENFSDKEAATGLSKRGHA